VSDKEPKEVFIPRSKQAIAICAAVTIALIAADLGSKYWATDALSVPLADGTMCPRERVVGERCRRPMCSELPEARREGSDCLNPLVGEYLEFRYAENTGAAFGIGRDWPTGLRVAVFGIAALAAAIGLMWMFVTGRGGVYFAYSVPLVVSGAVGNLVDRARLNHVVDFIRFHVADKWEYPTFNVADITIVIGVGLMLLDGWRKKPVVAAPKVDAPEEPAERPKKKRKKKRSEESPPADA
jgi:signal peptidase II